MYAINLSAMEQVTCYRSDASGIITVEGGNCSRGPLSLLIFALHHRKLKTHKFFLHILVSMVPVAIFAPTAASTEYAESSRQSRHALLCVLKQGHGQLNLYLNSNALSRTRAVHANVKPAVDRAASAVLGMHVHAQ